MYRYKKSILIGCRLLQMHKSYRYKNGIPTGIRTPVAGMKTRCPRPLDDRDALLKINLNMAYTIMLFLKMSSCIIRNLNFFSNFLQKHDIFCCGDRVFWQFLYILRLLRYSPDGDKMRRRHNNIPPAPENA